MKAKKISEITDRIKSLEGRMDPNDEDRGEIWHALCHEYEKKGWPAPNPLMSDSKVFDKFMELIIANGEEYEREQKSREESS